MKFKYSLLTAAMLFSTGQVYAAGFQISESTVTGLGRAFAGAGIAGDDASDQFYNPAGLFMTEGRQVQVGATYIDATSDFTNKGSTRRIGTQTFPSPGRASDAGAEGVVPNFYYILPFSENIKFGFNINAPYGLKTDYSKDWLGRYHAVESKLETIDFNPNMAYKINDKWAVGAGFSIQYAEAVLSQRQFTGTPQDGFAELRGDDVGFGFNTGITFQPSEQTRIGVGFRSKVEQRLDGDLDITVRGPDGQRVKQSISGKAEVDLPETIYTSIAHDLTDKTTLYASGRWTNWSRFNELRVKFKGGLPDSVTDENWNDAWLWSLGADYDYNDMFTFRVGYAFDETPVSSGFRTARIPDTDRHWLSAGVTMNWNKWSMDFGYAHLFSSGNNEIDHTIDLVSTQPGATADRLRGSYDGNADIYGLQFRYAFGE